VKKPSFHEAQVAEVANRPVVGHLNVTKLVKEHQPIYAAEGHGQSVGMFIDDYLAECVQDGDEIHEICVAFDPADWKRLANEIADARSIR
jgi:hypothetical protein